MHPLLSTALTVATAYRAYSHKSLTPLGIVAAVATSVVHSIHPFSTLTTCLLFGFYIVGTAATKHKNAIKQTLTVSSTGTSGEATPRTHVQVFANSISASILILVHYFLIYGDIKAGKEITFSLVSGGSWKDTLIVGVMTQYAAVCSDTLSSELGILSRSQPRLIYNPLKAVPPGTNGGVSLAGFVSGFAGSVWIAFICVLALPVAKEQASSSDELFKFKATIAGVVIAAGMLGTVLDSFLGATLQASVIDVKAGKIVESEGGEKVLVAGTVRRRLAAGKSGMGATAKTKAVSDGPSGSRKVYSGVDVLSNNGVNLAMAGIVAAGGVWWGWWYTQ
ncbi:hypothetical protein H072_3345 [Dactylellina haptotyla CBS 200.50]|uniref:DUF92 domain-containing protein n=1 Tax=Dactylellina haptotyla (strain CBS 200.50) TaxID=1284197 RepID=S8AIK1_DACHA|nr:hypothetical protein H072_3345 [Dactylellina haptotyla CBS 200.50]